MRKSPYSNYSFVESDKYYNKPKDYNEFLYQPINKHDVNKMYNNIVAYLPTPPGKSNQQFVLFQRNNKTPIKRPLTVNKTNAELKNKNEQRQHGSQNNRDLWVSTVKQTRNSSYSRQSDQFKGKVYRGSSWKFQDRSKIAVKQIKEATRYSHSSRLSNNLTPTSKQQRNSLKQTYRASNIYDLINKNLKEKIEQPKQSKRNEEFFEYVMRFSYRTKKGHVPSNPTKVNQDSFVIHPNIQNKTFQHFFAVCDGHGPLGHHVSGFIKNTLPNAILANKNLQKNPEQGLMKAFQVSYQKLIKQSQVDLTFSGSTIISTYLIQNKLYCCNVGDSRAIIGKYKERQKQWVAIPLSEDHKPSLSKQADRIRKMNGRIQPYKDQYGQQIGPLRVWVRNESVPGLAMTRSFGDLVGASVGVSPVPEIKQFTLSQEDRIIVIASDGVFQFLQNKKIIEELYQFYEKKQIQQGSDHLLNLAHKSWTQNSTIIDDITFILIFLNYNQV